ncbi:unnamed protein product [Alternaria alternata]
MFSPSQVLPFLDIVTNEVVTEVRRGNTTDDAETIAYNTKMYNKAGSSHSRAATEKAAFDANALSLGEQSDPSGFAAPTASKPIGKTPEQQAAIKEVTDFLKGEKGKKAALTMQTMVTAATPILNNFDELLTQPNLDKYNATLNTSPIVGLAGREIRYLNKTSTGTGAGTVTESWAHFDNLPVEADTAQGTVHLFPYNGSFYLSVGKSVWKKEPRPMTDANRVDAKNNWPKLFIEGWKKVGDKCLPAADLVTVAAHAAGTTADAVPTFSLFVAGTDGKLKVFKGNDLVDNVSFSDVTVTPKNKASDVKWKHLCYYAGKLFGVDTNSFSWNITVDTKDPTKVSIKDKTKQASTDGLSSNEQGLVALRNNKLWRQRVSKAGDDEEMATKEDTAWTHVVDCPGITYLGVASPGSLLDLRSLIQQLRDQYMKTQVDVMPLVTTIRRSSKQHLALTKLMEADAKAYEEAKEAEDEDKIAKIQKRAVERGVKGALKIAATINKASVNASNAIVNMGVALRGISEELTALQKAMETQLKALKETLQSQKDALKTVRDVQFWSLIVILVSFVALILTFGVAAPAIVVGLGILFAAAFIVNQIYESKESQMMSDIAKTQASVNSLESSIADLKKITPKFGELEIQYKALNMFWGRMSTSSGDLLSWTADAYKELADEMFDPVTIESARDSATELQDGSQMYLDMLTAQGIYLPEADPELGALQAPAAEPSTPPSDEHAFRALLEAVHQPLGNGIESDAQEVTVVSAGSEQYSLLNNIGASAGSKEFAMPNGSERSNREDGRFIERNQYIPSRVLLLTEQACVDQSDLAVQALERDDFDAFEAHMDVSTRLLDAPTTFRLDAIMQSGRWFDIDLIKQGVSVWLNSGLKDLLAYNNSTLNLDGIGIVNSGALLAGAKYISASVVLDTIKLAKLMQDWTADANSDLSDEQKAAQAKPYVNSAVGLCGDLASTTAKLNNGFNTINHTVTEARNKVAADVRALEDLIRSTDAGYWEKIARIQDDIPLILTIFWSRERLMDEIQHKAQQIEYARREEVGPLDDRKFRLEQLRDSGIIYQNQHISWVNLVQKLSVQFSRVWMTLKDIQEEIRSDVAFNADVIVGIEWPELLENAQQVLSLLNVDPHINFSAVLGGDDAAAERAAVLTAEAFFALEAPGAEDNDAGAFQGQVEDPMQFAIQAHPVMATLLADGTEETRQFFDNVKAIMVLPNVHTLKAYDDTLGSFSLHSSMAETVATYVRTFGSISKALNRIGSAASIQSRRVKRLEDKSIRWVTFYTGTRQAIIDASRYVGTANDDLEKSYKEMKALFQRIKENRNAFESKIKPIDELIAAKRKEVTDYIFQLAADAAAVMFVGAAAALAVVSGPAVAFKAASTVIKGATKVDGVVLTNTFKTFYSKMNWDEFRDSIASLSTLRDSLTTAVNSLDKILSTFSETLKYGQDLQKHLRESQRRLEDFEIERLSRVAAAEKRGETEAAVMERYMREVDFEEVVKGWGVVDVGCDVWNDMFNAQGYSLPADFEFE